MGACPREGQRRSGPPAGMAGAAFPLLSDLGSRIVGRSSSIEALEVFCNRPYDFDLVITDMTMPNLTGIDLAQQCLRIRPDLPIILCTGFSEEITVEKIRAMGIRELIMKPLLKHQLAAAIRRALDQKAGG